VTFNVRLFRRVCAKEDGHLCQTDNSNGFAYFEITEVENEKHPKLQVGGLIF
jgi:hypothetical protein